MAIQTKICGINSPAALDAAAQGGAGMVGFNFFPPSPRAVTPPQAAMLAARASGCLLLVGVSLVRADVASRVTLAAVQLDLIQLHGQEEPRRVSEIRARFGLPVMKAIKIATAEDLAAVESYATIVDRLLFDAKAPKTMKNALPGGNALSFDWRLLAGRRWHRPWMLSGGLRPDNVVEAVEITGATAVDVSSGVEERPGVKDPAMIQAFLEQSRAL